MTDAGPKFIAEVVRDADTALHAAMMLLLPQLDPQAAIPSIGALQAMLDAPGTHLLVARAERGTGPIVGMLTLSIVSTPSGVRAWIDDVVVDRGSRGRGIATRLMNEALRLAAAQQATTVALTSRPERVAANRLYERLGFVRRETNVYRYVIEKDRPAQ